MFRKILVFFIHVYQWIVSPLLPPSCRFYPTCSNYALQAIEKFGARQGMFLSLKRLIKCNPWHPGGYDPVK